MVKIAIHSVPRSGSTWLGNIFNSHPNVNFNFQPLFSYAFKDLLNENSNNEKINFFFSSLAQSKDPFINQLASIEKNLIPRFEKSAEFTHVCYKEVRYHNILANLLKVSPDIKVIGLIRNPFATINSWLRANKEFRKDLDWKIEDEWKYAPSKNLDKPEEFNGYNKWKEVAFQLINFKSLYPDNFYLLNYDDLLSNLEKTIEKLFHFCNLEMSIETLDFLNKSTNKNMLDAYSVYKLKNSDDQWKVQLSRYIIDEIMHDKEFQSINEIFKWVEI